MPGQWLARHNLPTLPNPWRLPFLLACCRFNLGSEPVEARRPGLCVAGRITPDTRDVDFVGVQVEPCDVRFDAQLRAAAQQVGAAWVHGVQLHCGRGGRSLASTDNCMLGA